MNLRFPVLSAHMLLAALLFSLNHWVAIIKNHGDYSPFSVSPASSSMTFDETHAYAPPAQRFMSSGRIPAEVDNYERQNLSAGIPFLPDAILGSMGWAFGSIDWAFIAADALFPALAFWLLYVASEGIVQLQSSRLMLAWATLLIPFGPHKFLWIGHDALQMGPDFARTPQPEISFTFVLIGVLVSARALHPRAQRGMAVFAGLAGALIVYSYYFYCIAWGIAVVMLLVLTVMWRNWVAARRTAVMLSVMIAASLPYLVATERGKAEGGQTELLSRMGAYTHAPKIVPLLCLLLGLLLVLRFGKRLFEDQEPQARLGIFILLLLAGLAGLNFQVLSGYDAQHGHFWAKLIAPVASFLCGCWILSTAERLKPGRVRLLNGVVLAGMISIVLNAGARQVYAGKQLAEQQRASQPEIELLRWTRQSLPFGSVVGTVNPDLILMLPALTPDFNYVPAGLRSLTPEKEIVNRYYQLASLLGMSTADVRSELTRQAHIDPMPELLFVLKYSGTPQTFLAGYTDYRPAQEDQERRLDYVVTTYGRPIPPAIAKDFPHARVVHCNPRLQIIALH